MGGAFPTTNPECFREQVNSNSEIFREQVDANRKNERRELRKLYRLLTELTALLATQLRNGGHSWTSLDLGGHSSTLRQLLVQLCPPMSSFGLRKCPAKATN